MTQNNSLNFADKNIQVEYDGLRLTVVVNGQRHVWTTGLPKLRNAAPIEEQPDGDYIVLVLEGEAPPSVEEVGNMEQLLGYALRCSFNGESFDGFDQVWVENGKVYLAGYYDTTKSQRDDIGDAASSLVDRSSPNGIYTLFAEGSPARKRGRKPKYDRYSGRLIEAGYEAGTRRVESIVSEYTIVSVMSAMDLMD